MTKESKSKFVQSLANTFSSQHFYIANTQGLDAADVNDLRKKCFERQVQYNIVKNTFISKALELLSHRTGEDYTNFSKQVLEGFSGVFTVQEEPSVPAQIIKSLQKSKLKQALLKGAVVNSQLYVGPEHLEVLSQLKSKSQMIGELICTLQAPVKWIVSALQSSRDKIASLVLALSK